ncbi:MAG: hypothetical protein ABR556_14135, partial [Pyrinomonadaceae bacterium]
MRLLVLANKISDADVGVPVVRGSSPTVREGVISSPTPSLTVGLLPRVRKLYGQPARPVSRDSAKL